MQFSFYQFLPFCCRGRANKADDSIPKSRNPSIHPSINQSINQIFQRMSSIVDDVVKCYLCE